MEGHETTEKMKCEICGTEENVGIYAGGPFPILCKSCEKIVVLVIERYLDMIGLMPFRVVAGAVYNHHFTKDGDEKRRRK